MSIHGSGGYPSIIIIIHLKLWPSSILSPLLNCLFLQLEKAQEQQRLLEESAKELDERKEREKELQKLIEEKEVTRMKLRQTA